MQRYGGMKDHLSIRPSILASICLGLSRTLFSSNMTQFGNPVDNWAVCFSHCDAFFWVRKEEKSFRVVKYPDGTI